MKLPPWEADSPITLHRRVKWGECDPAGVVYTPRFSDYVVEAVHEFFEHLLGGPLQQELKRLDLGTPAKALQFVFKRSLWPDEEFTLTIRVGRIRTRTFDLIVSGAGPGGEEAFEAIFSAICIYHQRRESRAIPPELLERLEGYRQRFPVENSEVSKQP